MRLGSLMIMLYLGTCGPYATVARCAFLHHEKRSGISVVAPIVGLPNALDSRSFRWYGQGTDEHPLVVTRILSRWFGDTHGLSTSMYIPLPELAPHPCGLGSGDGGLSFDA